MPKQLIPTEDQEQTAFCSWLTKTKVKFYAIPNGGSRNFFEAMKLQRTGVKSGVPDICIPVMRGEFGALYIEMKRQKGGKVSETQEEWLLYLSSSGYMAKVANGFDHARKIVESYLSLDS